MKDNKTHPVKHMRIQQLAKQVKEWYKAGDKRYTGTVKDNQSGRLFVIIADIYTKFAILVTAYKK